MTRPLLALVAAASLVAATAAPAGAASEPRLTCFPLGPAAVRYDDTWGAPRSGGRSHHGTDIMAEKGTTVLAAASGVVETMDVASGAGYYVRLVHRGGWETWYMHLDNDSPGTDDGAGGADTAYADGLSVGDRVVAGAVIGFVGDSGNAEWTGSHLHFELHVGGSASDPYDAVVEADQRIDRLRRRMDNVVTDPGPAVTAELASRPDMGCLEPRLRPEPAVPDAPPAPRLR